MPLKIKISFVIPEALQKEFKEKMVLDGYGLRGKSLWVSDAIKHLVKIDNYKDLIKVNDEMRGFGKLESIMIDEEVKSLISEAILCVRKRYPEIDGIQSMVVRTAIIQRLLNFPVTGMLHK